MRAYSEITKYYEMKILQVCTWGKMYYLSELESLILLAIYQVAYSHSTLVSMSH